MNESEKEQQYQPYTETHRVLLTHIRSSKYINQKNLIEDFGLVLERLDPNLLSSSSIETLLETHISSINTRINQHRFKIDKRNHEVTGELYYIYINLISDELIKTNSTYSINELDSIKKLIDDIIESSNFKYSISRINAQQRISSLLNRTLRDSNFFINRLIDDGWIELTLNEHLILSIKSVSELKHYLIDRYGLNNELSVGKILLCKQCNGIVTLGYTCKNDNCSISFHYKCLTIFSRNNSSLTKCINDNCLENWNEDNLIRVGADPNSLLL